jgi:hypothetical protein
VFLIASCDSIIKMSPHNNLNHIFCETQFIMLFERVMFCLTAR